MLHARKFGFWKERYEITTDGQVLTIWEPSTWRNGGTFDWEGRRYEIRSNLWGNRYGMTTTEDGAAVASASRVGRKRWTVEADGQVLEFQRASIWRHEEILHAEGRRLGSVKRASIWRRDVLADLPGRPVPVQVFVLAVVLARWNTAATGAAPGGGNG